MAAAETTRARAVANGARVDVDNEVRIAAVTNRARITAVAATVTRIATVATGAVIISAAAATTTIRTRATT
jgi:hypothetical protein